MLYFIIIIIIIYLSFYILFPFPPKIKNQTYDCIIVLGYPTNQDGTISKTLKLRCDEAINLAINLKINNIIVSGSSVHNQHSEAKCMYDYLIKHLTTSNIIIENKAKNTYDNLKYSYDICLQNKYHNVIVVSSHYHLRRANFMVKKFFTNYALSAHPQSKSILKSLQEYPHYLNTLKYEISKKSN